MKNQKNVRVVIALAIYLAFTLAFGAANLLSHIGEREGTLETMDPIAGMLMGLLVFPVFGLALPLWLARRWGLEFSFWPRSKRWPLAVAVVALYVLLTQQQTIESVAGMGIAPFDYLIHFTSSSLFHISYYPLLVGFVMPVVRDRFGLAAGLLGTAALFALFHLAGFYYFEAGTTLRMQVLLFAAFLASQILYLWTESLIMVALAHSVNGSLGLAVNGTLFNQVDEMLIVTAFLMTGLFAYMIVYEVRHRGRPRRAGFWLQTKIDRGRSEGL
jgi:hypothetical protein